MNMKIIPELERLYKTLPEVDCQQCGLCCVSPTCTLSEFIYLFHTLLRTTAFGKIKQYIEIPPEPHPEYPGNVRCIFLENNRCSIHAARTAACRLFGIPSLKELNIANMETCRHAITVTSGNSDISFLQSWLDKLCDLDRTLYAYGSEPYFIKGFNIHCWLDIYFDDFFDFDAFRDITRVMKHYIDLTAFREYYICRTGLKEKVDKIGILSTLLACGDKNLLQPLLISIRDDYPATGTYFQDEAVAFCDVLEKEGTV